MSEQEWAIRETATGDWWTGEHWSSAARDAWRYSTFPIAMASGQRQLVLQQQCEMDYRIVPAPHREMTDAESWEWLRAQYSNGHGANSDLALVPAHDDVAPNQWCVSRYTHNECVATGITPCDAIRAARRKLEEKP